MPERTNRGTVADHDGLRAPAILLSPGPEYGTRGRKWQGIPGIERAPNGRLWAMWYSGSDGEGPGNFVVVVTSADDGATWSEPVLVVDPGPGRRAFDECMWHDPQGRLWIFWSQSGGDVWYDGRGGVWALCAEPGASDSVTPAWSEPRRLFHGVMMNKPTVVSNGDWFLPIAVWDYPGAPAHDEVKPYAGSAVVVSTDQGRTFAWRGAARDVPCRGYDEHMIVERKDGSLWMLIRTHYGIAQSESRDGGSTWTRGRATAIEGPDSRFHIRRLRSGRLLLVNHYHSSDPAGVQSGRSHLTALLSEDDGRTWLGGLLLDERERVSYPDGVQAPEGLIYTIYDFNRGDRWAAGDDREILMAVFTEEDILAGRCVTPKARLRQTVNKIPGNP